MLVNDIGDLFAGKVQKLRDGLEITQWNDVLRVIDDSECIFLVLLDLSVAFDTADHFRLQKRLTNYFGISPKTLSWVNLYLSDRQLDVAVCDVESNENTPKDGVPQGSVLGPVFFKDYIVYSC